ncbi:interleukin-27 subunit alpha [Centroberyx affinis]|uniref:interleukin-27 subunit alpha n=1 Tax=Centroberyx affinis TaxID=166261 RepID=UPI003A5BDD4F
MTVWWRALFPLCCILSCVALCCASTPVLQRAKYSNSLRLTRFTRARVQHLLKKYKEQQLGNKNFENRSRQLKALPVLSTDFHSWLKLTDWERLRTAAWDLHTYWDMLEQKRKQLEQAEKEQMAAQELRPAITLPQSIEHIQLDLRDLMRQVNRQMNHVNGSRVSPTSPSVPPASQGPPLSHQPPSQMLWDSRVEGYIILRDLDLYLTKLARDFLLLASKTHP